MLTNEEKLKESVFFVEAGSYETLCLWKDFRGKYTFVQDNLGFWQVIGYINEDRSMPVGVSFSFVIIAGRRVCYYETTSRFVDTEMVEKFLKDNYPKTWDNGRRDAMTNAMNFHHVLDHIRTLNS